MAAEWWTRDEPPISKYTLSEQLRRSFWGTGFGQAWFTCDTMELPYRCGGIWRGGSFEMEWEPRQYLHLKADEISQKVVEGFTTILRLEPLCRYRQNGKQIVEWREVGLADRLTSLQESSEVENFEPLVELSK